MRGPAGPEHPELVHDPLRTDDRQSQISPPNRPLIQCAPIIITFFFSSSPTPFFQHSYINTVDCIHMSLSCALLAVGCPDAHPQLRGTFDPAFQPAAEVLRQLVAEGTIPGGGLSISLKHKKMW